MAYIHPRLPERIRKRLTSRAAVWRDPDATSETPAANSDDWGLPVETVAPDAEEDTGRRLQATYDCEYGPVNPGEETITIEKVDAIAPYAFSFLQIDLVDVRAGDQLRVDGATYSVIHPGGNSTHDLFRVVRCQLIS